MFFDHNKKDYFYLYDFFSTLEITYCLNKTITFHCGIYNICRCTLYVYQIVKIYIYQKSLLAPGLESWHYLGLSLTFCVNFLWLNFLIYKMGREIGTFSWGFLWGWNQIMYLKHLAQGLGKQSASCLKLSVCTIYCKAVCIKDKSIKPRLNLYGTSFYAVLSNLLYLYFLSR